MIVHFIATQHSIDINYTYLKKIHDTINQLRHKPSRKWLSKERRFIESIILSELAMKLFEGLSMEKSIQSAHVSTARILTSRSQQNL